MPVDGRWRREKRGDGTTSRTDKRHERRCHNERRQQMGGGGVRRGNVTTTREGRDECPESSVDTADGSLMARYGATAPRWQWTARRLLDGEGRRDGSSTAMDGVTAPRRQGTAREGSSTARDGARRLLDGKGRRERGDDGPRAQRRWVAMDGAMAN